LNSCFRRNGRFSNSGIVAVTDEATFLTGEVQISCTLGIIIRSSGQRLVWVGAYQERRRAFRPTDNWITGAAIARRTNWIADGHHVIVFTFGTLDAAFDPLGGKAERIVITDE
jgi:hypothetical protein